MKITASVKENQTYFDKRLQVDQSFDLISRPLQVGGRMPFSILLTVSAEKISCRKCSSIFWEYRQRKCPGMLNA